MKFFLVFFISQSILLPLIAGLIRLRRIDRTYQPFFILIITGFIAEIMSFIMSELPGGSNAIPSNINALVEFILIAWQFFVWGIPRQRKWIFYTILVVSILSWTIENLFFGRITQFSPYFRFLACFLIVILSVTKINFMITHDNRNLFRNPGFLICIGFIIYFIYKILYEWSFQVSVFGPTEVTRTIVFWMAYVNVMANIIYAIALLLIPAPQKFTLE